MTTTVRLALSCAALSSVAPHAAAQFAASKRVESAESDTPDARAAATIAQMTQDEKFAWISGPMAIPV